MELGTLKKIVGGCLAVIVLVILLLGAGEDTVLRNLISQRIDIMNGYFAGETSCYQAAEALKSVETGNLLKEDTQALWSHFRTDIENVSHYSIEEVDVTYQDETLICAVVTVDWVVDAMPEITWAEETLQGEETPKESLTVYYSVIAEKENDVYKLVQFF